MEKPKIFKKDDRVIAEIQRMKVAEDLNLTSLILAQAFINWHKAFMKVLSPFELTYSQWIILQTLMVAGSPMSPTELNRYLTIEGTSISVVIDNIEKRGLVQRRRSQVDRRIVNIYLTEPGYELLKEIDPLLKTLIEDVYGLLSVTERKQLMKLSRKIRDASIKKNGGNPDVGDVIVEKFSGLELKKS
jgi:MarR family 2-MHQ and catechol resistance regulon transcriptional repressor